MTTVYITVTSDSVEDGIAPQVICTSLYLAEAQYKQNEFNAAGKITPTGRQLVANVLQVNVPEGK